jgi:hypothetical protein
MLTKEAVFQLGPDLDPANATRDQNINMTNQISLTDQEKQAQLDLDQLKQLVGLVDYDQSNDPFPVNGWDAIVFVVGNATQAASYYQSTWGSTGTTAASDAVPAGRPLPGSTPVIGRHAPANLRSRRAGDGLPCSRRYLLNVPRPLRRGVHRRRAERTDERCDGRGIEGEAAQRIRRRDNGVAGALQFAGHAGESGRVGERAMHQNDRRRRGCGHERCP